MSIDDPVNFDLEQMKSVVANGGSLTKRQMIFLIDQVQKLRVTVSIAVQAVEHILKNAGAA